MLVVPESLGLYNVYMSGVIPDSLYDLSDLRELFLRNNNPGFEGSLKANIGNLTKLTHLDISGNTLLTGTLPSELGNCEDLGELLCMCVDYQLTGKTSLSQTIMSQCHNSPTTEYLHLFNTNIQGAVPQEGELASLHFHVN